MATSAKTFEELKRHKHITDLSVTADLIDVEPKDPEKLNAEDIKNAYRIGAITDLTVKADLIKNFTPTDPKQGAPVKNQSAPTPQAASAETQSTPASTKTKSETKSTKKPVETKSAEKSATTETKEVK